MHRANASHACSPTLILLQETIRNLEPAPPQPLARYLKYLQLKVARRYLLWGIAMAGPAGMSAVPLLNRWLLLPNPGPDIAWMLFQSALGLLAAGGMAAAFLSRGSRARAETNA